MDTNEVECPYCGAVYCRKGIGSHIWRAHGDGINHDPNSYKTKPSWSKGMTKETNETVRRISEKLKRTKTPLEMKLDDDGKLIQKWQNKRANAKKEGLKCLLSFDEYCLLVEASGLVSSDIGFSGGGYVLARYGDPGNYEYGNCRFITQKENSDEKNDRLYPNRRKKIDGALGTGYPPYLGYGISRFDSGRSDSIGFYFWAEKYEPIKFIFLGGIYADFYKRGA